MAVHQQIVYDKLNSAQGNLAYAKAIAAPNVNNTYLAVAQRFCDFAKSDCDVAQYILSAGSPPAGSDAKFDTARTNIAWAKAFIPANANNTAKAYSRAFAELAFTNISEIEDDLNATATVGDWVPANPWVAPAVGDFPNASNSGLSNPAALSTINGTLQPGVGQVIENKDINGRVDLSSGVVLRNCRVRTDDYYVIRVSDGVEGCLFENCEFDGLNGICNAVVGGGEGSWTMKRTYVHGGEDGVKMTRNCVMRDSRLTNNGGSAGDPHFDEIQIMVGFNIEIYHCYLEVPAMPGNTSAVFIKTDFGMTNPINDVRVKYCYLNGGSHTLTSVAGNGPVPTNVRVDFNRFGPRHDYGYMQVQGVLASNVGNVFM